MPVCFYRIVELYFLHGVLSYQTIEIIKKISWLNKIIKIASLNFTYKDNLDIFSLFRGE